MHDHDARLLSVNVVEALRGDRSKRPLIDIASAGGLRSLLEDGIFEIIGAQKLDTPLVVRTSSLQQRFATTDLAMSTPGRLRGVLIGQLLRLLSVGMSIDHAFDDAVTAWRAEVGTGELIEQLDALDGDDRARLATDLEAHCVTLTRALARSRRAGCHAVACARPNDSPAATSCCATSLTS